jgi:hypothetical protein
LEFVRKLLLKLKGRSRENNCSTEVSKDNNDYANAMYESFEYGHKYTKQEISSGICQMKHRNEL